MSPPWRALESRRLRTQLMTWTARPPDSADANMFQNSFIFFIYDLQEVPAGFHVGHHGRHSILYLRNGCCQGAHGGTVGHIGYAGGRNLHGGAYMPDVARCIILRRRCPAIDKVGHRAASIEAAVILQQLDECRRPSRGTGRTTCPVRGAPLLANRWRQKVGYCRDCCCAVPGAFGLCFAIFDTCRLRLSI